jgi:hypothetical protein
MLKFLQFKYGLVLQQYKAKQSIFTLMTQQMS